METIGIREVSGERIMAAADRGEVLGITNGRVLAGVLMPLVPETVDRLVDQNLTRILHSIREGEREFKDGNSVDLEALTEEPSDPSGHRAPARVTIRGLSGARLDEAAERHEALVVTHGGTDVALLVPVTPQWVERLVERNLSRIRDSIDRGEHEIVIGAAVPTLDELLEEAETSTEEFTDPLTTSEHPSAPRPVTGGLLQQRAIGIKIISDDVDSRDRLVGVVTDMLGRLVHGPIETLLPDLDQGHVLASIVDLIDELRATLRPDQEHLIGVGMGIGGHVRRGTIVNSPNASWHRFPLASLVQQHVDVPVVLENDANSLAVRERFIKGTDDESTAVILITDRGVGASLILNGRVFRGAHGMAGELGHVPVEFSHPNSKTKCRCQSPGCLEGATAPYAIDRTLAEAGYSAGFDAAVAEATTSGGPIPTVFHRAGEALGRAIATLVNLFNPSTIVLIGPQALVGAPRTFRNGADAAQEGATGLYMNAMERTINNHAFSTGADDCQFIVRQVNDAEGAAAAAACIIEQFAPLGGPYAPSQHG
ncbi:ROK family protein [Streptomyces sp. NPDC050534]|uniref:ROK family protein n=1 Tax=Streptomyces sp. NPDC050534 TaxID=3365625 RepID=UPI0037883DCD